MVMGLSECNLSRITETQLQSCLSDCQQRFPLKFSIVFGPLSSLIKDNLETKAGAHLTCNNWRWHSSALTAVAIGAAAIGLAYLLLSSKKQQAKPLPSNIVIVKPPATTEITRMTVSRSVFSIFKR